MAKTYAWRKSGRFKSDPQAVGELIDNLADTYQQTVTAPMLVDAARDPNSPAHIDMTWDNEEAAELHRQNEARHMLGGIVFTVASRSDSDAAINRDNYEPELGSPDKPIRAFVHNPLDGGYVPVTVLAGQSVAAEQMRIAWLNEALRDYRRLAKRYAGAQELFALFQETDKLEELLGQ
jgi:hypothetical protein